MKIIMTIWYILLACGIAFGLFYSITPGMLMDSRFLTVRTEIFSDQTWAMYTKERLLFVTGTLSINLGIALIMLTAVIQFTVSKISQNLALQKNLKELFSEGNHSVSARQIISRFEDEYPLIASLADSRAEGYTCHEARQLLSRARRLEKKSQRNRTRGDMNKNSEAMMDLFK